MKKLIYVFVIALLATGCASVQQIRLAKEPLIDKLKTESSIYVLIPENGSHGEVIYQNSGRTIALFISAAFSRHMYQVEMSDNAETLEIGLNKARAKGYQYIISPQILHWENRATVVSSMPDRVEVKVNIYETSSADLLDSVIIKGKSNAALSDGVPEDLLRNPINRYIDSLF